MVRDLRCRQVRDTRSRPGHPPRDGRPDRDHRQGCGVRQGCSVRQGGRVGQGRGGRWAQPPGRPATQGRVEPVHPRVRRRRQPGAVRQAAARSGPAGSGHRRSRSGCRGGGPGRVPRPGGEGDDRHQGPSARSVQDRRNREPARGRGALEGRALPVRAGRHPAARRLRPPVPGAGGCLEIRHRQGRRAHGRGDRGPVMPAATALDAVRRWCTAPSVDGRPGGARPSRPSDVGPAPALPQTKVTAGG